MLPNNNKGTRVKLLSVLEEKATIPGFAKLAFFLHLPLPHELHWYVTNFKGAGRGDGVRVK
jgi:hypothetical protein